MNRVAHLLILPLVLATYIGAFMIQERLFRGVVMELRPVPSSRFLQATAGYFKQLAAEVIFVQSGVFLGGIDQAKAKPVEYAPTLTHNYRQVTALYPEFQDPYYYTQAYLADVGPEYTRAANEILANGRKAHPESFIFPFFQGYNHFSYLDEPLEAAAIFREVSLQPKAPPMFAHLAVILSAEGGMLEASIISLMVLIKSTEDEAVKQHYQEEVAMFKSALAVQKAVNAFQVARIRTPATLDELVPEFLPALPTFGQAFELTWKPPVVGLKRPSRK